MGEALQLLLVDDDLDTRSLMEGVLRREGFEVTCAASAEEALERLPSQTWDLLLTDVKLSDSGSPREPHKHGSTDGVALAQEVWKRRPELPVAMLSGYRGESVAALRGEKRLLAYFEKPIYDLRGMANALKASLERYRGSSIPQR